MIRPARACCSLALLACSSAHCHRTTATFVFKSSSTTRASLMSRADMSSTAEVDVAANLASVQENIKNGVRLVAVSKTKPVTLLMDAYNAGQRVFGENYVQELVSKAQEMPPDVQWHFIGPLQSNKANLLAKSVPNLTVETVATMKLANKLNKAMQDIDESDEKLKVYVQVNTSGEASKSGTSPGEETVKICQDILQECPRLSLQGLMTIGAPGDTSCFETLVECRKQVLGAVDLDEMELSMGMSGDYQTAMEYGATNVRVGSTIFGARDYSNLKK